MTPEEQQQVMENFMQKQMMAAPMASDYKGAVAGVVNQLWKQGLGI